jgi:Holliday junction resolvase RusA-like endonuclease
MHTINIKPLSVNQAWQGRRYKTPIYKRYERDVLLLLPRGSVPAGKLTLTVEVGFSNPGSDVDNIIKPLLDILQKKYRFNDSTVYQIVAQKVDVRKGCEYIKWDLEPYG